MKFARYLEDTQAPEWKRAYIDYRGLKKCISEIRKSQEEYTAHFSTTDSPPLRPQSFRFSFNGRSFLPENVLGLSRAVRAESPNIPNQSPVNYDQDHVILIQPPEKAFGYGNWNPEIENADHTSMHKVHTAEAVPFPSSFLNNDVPRPHQVKANRGLPMFQGNSNPLRCRRHHRSTTGAGIDPALIVGSPFSEITRLLTPQEQQFFVMLDAELEKVDAFYAMKEKELQTRSRRLGEQLKELTIHKHVIRRTSSSRTLPRAVKLCLSLSNTLEDGASVMAENIALGEFQTMNPPRDREPVDTKVIRHSNDPDDYMYAKRNLKRATMEHYREIEALVNFRILNITGFRKALKKFEKVTKVPVQKQYMSEKVDKSGFVSGQPVKQMMQEMEKLYAQVFMRNDSKDAREYLRGGGRRVTSHHFSAFRTGLFWGLGLLLLISAAYELSQNQIPDWKSLLHIYGIFFLPTIFPILVVLNALAWAHFRINYVFIFELDTRTRLDHRKYLELPTIIFASFCLSARLSFSNIGHTHPHSHFIPLAWLGFVAILLVNPFKIGFRDSRYWFLRLFGNLFLSGMRRVEFADFWLADQLCSFTYTFGGLVYICCIYNVGFKEQKCGSDARIWPAQWIMSSFPLLIRLVQCVKRYYDTLLKMHLVNASRYASGIIGMLLFYSWRASGSSGYLTAWCMANTFYSLFSCGWDFCMDWSILSLRSPNPSLREELVYADYIYYIAIIVNVILRFIWILYIPQPNSGWSFGVRSFVVGLFEMLRRFQWNFFRLESEHIGNVDQYRIVREVPLPYTFDETHSLEDDDYSSRD